MSSVLCAERDKDWNIATHRRGMICRSDIAAIQGIVSAPIPNEYADALGGRWNVGRSLDKARAARLMSSARRRGRAAAAVLAAMLLGANVAIVMTIVRNTPAMADTAPVDPSLPETVSAAALPTVQINGVVWAQVIVGNRVYATGQFSRARPAGAALGTNETPRSNILAYDLTTGALVTSWAPTMNAQGLRLPAS